MLTMKRVVGPLTFAAAALLFATAAGAATTSDQPASVVIYPKIVFSSGGTVEGPVPTDTIIEIANTSTSQLDLHCFYVNATSHCTNTGLACVTGLDCGGTGSCVPGWAETDFDVALTMNQPFYWKASTGRNRSCAANPGATCEPIPLEGIGFCNDPSQRPCTSNNQCTPPASCSITNQSNAGTSIPPLPEPDFYVGELKCVAVNGLGEPINSNSVIGTATIVTDFGTFVDAESYNAVGIKANSRCTNDQTIVCNTDLDCGGGVGSCQPVDPSGSNVLVLGPDNDPNAAYQGCPDTLVVDHIFDGAPDPLSPPADDNIFVTDLTLVPCSEDFEIGAADLGRSTAQFLVFNEFEQRFSTSVPVTCFDESLLSNLDTRNNSRSIFSASVSGTVEGQTRIHPIGDGLLGVALVQRPAGPFPTDLTDISAAITSTGLPPIIGAGAGYSIHEQGDRSTEDQIILP